MTTLLNLIEDTLLDMQGYTYRQDRATYINQSCTSSDLVLNVASTDNIGKGIIEIDDELMWVDSYDRISNTITIAPYGRGYNNTTASAHSSNAKVTISPTYPRVAVKRAINDTINAVYPKVFAYGRTSFNYLASRTTYDIPASAISVLSMTWQSIGPSREWIPIKHWRPDYQQYAGGSSLLTTGKSVTIYDRVLPGRLVNLVYSKLPTNLDNLTDDFETVSGLPSSMRDVIIYGAAYRLSSYIDPARISITSAAADELDTKRPYGTGANITKQLLAIYMQRLEEEALKQKQQFPIRIHSTR